MLLVIRKKDFITTDYRSHVVWSITYYIQGKITESTISIESRTLKGGMA